MRILIIFVFLSSFAQADCLSWFKASGVKPADKDCEIKCVVLGVDMGTYQCPDACDKLCKTKPKCSPDPFWMKAINSNPSPFKSLSGLNKKRILNALTHLPKDFRPKSLKAIFKATQPDFMSPQNPASSSDEFIILFPKAFTSDALIDRILLHEVTHHLIYSEWSQDFSLYKKDMAWEKVDSRKGKFVEPDGQTSPEEDFANNIEYFIYESEKLKQVSPKIFEWIEKKMKSRLKLEKGCDEKNRI